MINVPPRYDLRDRDDCWRWAELWVERTRCASREQCLESERSVGAYCRETQHEAIGPKSMWMWIYGYGWG